MLRKELIMQCELCSDEFTVNDDGRPQGRFPTVKSWAKVDDNFVPSFRSLQVHKKCVYDLLEKNGVSLSVLIG